MGRDLSRSRSQLGSPTNLTMLGSIQQGVLNMEFIANQEVEVIINGASQLVKN